jgi:hypothetical protein
MLNAGDALNLPILNADSGLLCFATLANVYVFAFVLTLRVQVTRAQLTAAPFDLCSTSLLFTWPLSLLSAGRAFSASLRMRGMPALFSTALTAALCSRRGSNSQRCSAG